MSFSHFKHNKVKAEILCITYIKSYNFICESSVKTSQAFKHESYNMTQYYGSFHTVSVARVEGKAVPLEARTGPEGSRRLMLPDFNAIGKLLYCGRVPDALQPKAYCTNPGL